MSHIPVLLRETVDAWRGSAARASGVWVDCTVGGGGHTRALLASTPPSCRVLGIDRDIATLQRTAGRLARVHEAAQRVLLAHSSYVHLRLLLKLADLPAQVDGITADLGLSSFQLDQPERGFSVRADGPLDMRFDGDREAASSDSTTRSVEGIRILRDPAYAEIAPTATAGDLVNVLPEGQLARIFAEYGEEEFAEHAARAVVDRRTRQRFERTLDLAAVLGDAISRARRGRYRNSRTTSTIHPATKCFQALRIAVNGELGAVQRLLDEAPTLLAPGGRFAVLTFHSLEDRLVKRAFDALCRDGDASDSSADTRKGHRAASQQPAFRMVLPGKFAVPTEKEIAANPRSRSAKLRAIERMR